jgi:glycosyltransferase involved in cell wall biosynthesis
MSLPAPSPDSPSSAAERPVIGLVLIGGLLSGALVRDTRLANELVERGYEVHAWWAMDRFGSTPLRPEIRQHWLFNGFRFAWPRAGAAVEPLGRACSAAFSDRARSHWVQRRPGVMRRLMENLLRCVCEGVDRERGIVRRFARELAAHRVTHILPMLELLGPWAAAARACMPRPARYLVTFQGYELYSTYARAIGLEAAFYRRLRESVEQSDWPAIAVSADYLERVIEEVGVPRARLAAIPPGVPAAAPIEHDRATALVKERFSDYDPALPLVSFLGRRDAEKGIDLLLYAAAILRRRGMKFQLAVCGPSLWGDHYGEVCRRIAEELLCPVLWRRFVPDETRTAIFTLSRCVVYPSIHREPFGMVAAEVAAHGTPALVPDLGGVSGAIEAGGEMAGLRFRAFDSGDLAEKLAQLLEDDALHARLSRAGPRVAEHYSIRRLGDRVLRHLGLPGQPNPNHVS